MCHVRQVSCAPAHKGVCADEVVVIDEAGECVLAGVVHEQPEALIPDRVPAVGLDRALQPPVGADV